MRRITRTWSLFGLVASLTLAGAADAQAKRTRIALPMFGAQVVMDTIGEQVEFPVSAGRLFTATATVLANMKIPIDVSDSVGGLIGAAKLMRSRNLDRTPLSVYFNCGSSMTGPRADSYRIQMPLLIMIDPSGPDKAKLRIALVGSAQDPTGSSNQPVNCGSTGALEVRMRKAIGEQLAASPPPSP